MTRKDIEKEIGRRAAWHKPQTHVIADYYRIRRKLAYPLPLREMVLPKMPVAGIAAYPWSIWVLWDFEDRVNSLGWAGTWFEDEEAQNLVRRDLGALADWPCYRQYERPDLSLGHCARMMWLAYTQWAWLDDVKAKIEDAFARIVADALKYSDEHHGRFVSKADILALEQPHSVLHNIPLIGTVGIALAAHTIGHESASVLDQRLHAILGAILDLRQKGHTEGVGYDGYIMDFVVHWLQVIDVKGRMSMMNHRRFGDLLNESVFLSAPGEGAQVAEIGDVEPKEMPFHLSAHAKLLTLKPNACAAWHLKQCRIDWLKADALGALHRVMRRMRGQEPQAGAQDACYALMLRSGWNADDVAVVMSASNSPMSHLPPDEGTLLIGSHGKWLIADPGYQQYMKKREREFTLGATAHNAPVINGQAVVHKPTDRIVGLDDLGGGMFQAKVNLTPCYPDALNLKMATRTVWLKGKNLVVVADCVKGEGIDRVSYTWHGHKDAAWWVAEGWARIYFPDVLLWITCPQAQLTDAQVDRLPGSRGQLSLCADADAQAPVIWWVFGFGDRAPTVRVSGKGEVLEVDGLVFRVP